MEFEERENSITCLGETNFRNHRRRFGIKRADRRAQPSDVTSVVVPLLGEVLLYALDFADQLC